MSNKTYDRSQAESLLPLLDSILREIEDRRKILRSQESHKAKIAGSEDAEWHNLLADIADNKRQLRLAEEELTRLGCSIENQKSLLVRIPGQAGESFLWQPGHPIQELQPIG